MSSFECDKCGFLCVNTSTGYITGCEHYPADGSGKKFNCGDEVYVPIFNDKGDPDKALGVIKSVAPTYFMQDVNFEVHGEGLVTIVSINSIRHAKGGVSHE